MNGFMNIRVRLLTGSANAQMKALRENLEKFDASFKSVRKTSASMSGIKIFGADQIKRMREARDVSARLKTNFDSLDRSLKSLAKSQATVSQRQYVRKDQIAAVQTMNVELKQLTKTIGVYKVASAGVSKIQFMSPQQTASLNRLNKSLETVARMSVVVQREGAKMAATPLATPAQTAEIANLKKQVQALRQSIVSAQAAGAKGVHVTGSAAPGAAPGMAGGVGRADEATKRYTTSLRANQNSMARWGSQLQWAGRQLQYNFTLPLLLAGGFAMKFALDQEKAMVHVKKVYGDEADAVQWFMKTQQMSREQATAAAKKTMNEELGALDNYFSELSTYFATNKTEVLEVAGAWAAAGVSGQQLAESVRNTLTAAAIGDMSTEQATKALISIQAQYGLNAKGLGDALAYLNSVENATGAGMQDLITGFQKAAGVARNGGISVRYLAADIAALTPAAGNAAEAGNALKSIIGALARPTKAASIAIKQLGFDTESTEWASMSMQERLLAMSKNFGTLAKSQQNTVAVTIAGRWQFNRFSALMRELSDENGYYQKALNATSSRTKSLGIAQAELNTILQSNPARLKRVGVALQNSMADIIQPLIPAIISLAQTVADATKAFENLPDPIKKVAMYLAIFLIVMPLVVRYIGAMGTLLGYMRVGFLAAGGAITFFSGAMMTVLLFPFAAIARAWTAMAMAIAFVYGKAMAAVRVAAMLTSATVLLSMRGIATGILALNFAKIISFALLIPWRAGLLLMVRMAAVNVAALIVVMRAGLVSGLLSLGSAILAAFASPWILAFAAVAVLFYAFRDQLAQIWQNIVQSLDGGYLQEMFANVVRNTIAAFNALPQGVQNALIAVVNIVREAALAVYDWFSYLNPWAHHSPSLVENVRTGMAAVNKEFQSLQSLQKYIKSTYAVIQKFGDATARLQAANRSLSEKSDRGLIAKGAPGALKLYDNLINRLHTLQSMYDRLGERIAKAQAKIAPGLAKAEEAIWRNEYAQKRLQLQIAKLEQKYGDLQKAREKLAAIEQEQNGLAEISSGLRAAGAGSDVLKFYDDQIAALEAQKAPLNSAASQLEQLQAQLEKLQQTGNILNLTKEVQFGPALHQIDLMEEKYQRIGQTISDIKSAINDATQAQSALNQAAEQKKNAKKAGKKGGAAGGAGADKLPGGVGNFARAGGKGMKPRTNWDSQAKDIDDMTDKLMQDAADAFGKVNPFKSLVGWFKKTLDNIKSRLLPDGQKLMNAIFGGGDAGKAAATLDTIQAKFRAFGDGIRNGIRAIVDIGKMLWGFFGPELTDIFESLKATFQDAWKYIGPELAAWGRDIQPIAEALWNLAKVVLGVVGIVVKVLLGTLGGALRGFLAGVIQIFVGLSKAVRGVLKFLGGIINFLYHLFTGQWGKLGDDLMDIWNGLWAAIGGIAQAAIGVVVAIVGGLITGIIGLFKSLGRLIMIPLKWVWDKIVAGFKWLWDVLVGHSIVPDIVNGIIATFKLLAGVAMWIWNNVLVPIYHFFMAAWNNLIKPAVTFWWSAIKVVWAGLATAGAWIWRNVLVPIYSRIKSIWGNFIKPAFGAWWAGIKVVWGALKTAATWIWNNVLNPVYQRVKGIFSNYIKPSLEGWWSRIKTAFSALKTMGKWIWDNALNPVFSRFKDVITKIGNWITENKSKITAPFKSMINFAIKGVNKMTSGLNKVADVLPGLKWHIKAIPELAEGGAIPNRKVGAGWKTNGARAIVGEGKANHPEYVVPTDPTHRSRALGLWKSLGERLGALDSKSKTVFDGMHSGFSKQGVPMYGIGGVLGKAIATAAGGVKKAGKFAKGLARNAASVAYKPFGAGVDGFINNIGWKYAHDPMEWGHKKVKAWIKGADEFANEAKKVNGTGWKKMLQAPYSIGGGLGSYKGHNGQDFPISGSARNVMAMTGGIVTSSRDIAPIAGRRNSGGYGSYGRVVEIRHSNGYRSLYAHNSSRLVQTGDLVSPGDVIAKSGNTGNSSGHHSHLSIWKGGALQEPLNVLRKYGVKMSNGGIARATTGGIAATIAEGGQDELVTPLPRGFDPGNLGGTKNYHFHDATFSFPNITDPDDAEEFLRNLENSIKD